ncbi:MAG: protein translocase subunit SecD [Rhodomicrobiaceae bacterium]
MLHFSRWKTFIVWGFALLGVFCAAPNLIPEKDLAKYPQFVQNLRLNLGLDLRGGSHLLLQMDKDLLIEKQIKILRGNVRTALRGKREGTARTGAIRYRDLSAKKDRVEFKPSDPADLEKAYQAARTLIQPLPSTSFGTTPGNNVDVEKTADGRIVVKPSEPAITAKISSSIDSAIEVVRRRVDALGTTEPSIQRQGEDRILLQVPGFDDPEKLKAVVKQAAVLSFHLVVRPANAEEATDGLTEPGTTIYPSKDQYSSHYILEDEPLITGADLANARQEISPQTSRPVVSFRLNSRGGVRFGDVTAANVGRPFAIVLDGEVISAPTIQEAITGGSGQISGNFTVSTADDLAILLRSGSLEAPLTILEERTVNASLGEDSIAAGKLAAMIGLVGVVLFILMAYGTFGLYANIALLINIAMIIGALSLLQATLTLPGIAGIVLTMGMAVDANVLIFERIREELRAGKTAISAIESGYSRALSTILDANITTFLAAIILFWLGSGPVSGFAVTLSIGIVTSVFTAFVLTRWLIAWWLRSQRSKTVDMPI